MQRKPDPAEASIPVDDAVPITFITVAAEEQGHKVVLKENSEAQGQVEMFVGGSEFAAIAKELGLIEPPRPLTHDVYFALTEGLDLKFDRLEIYGLKENAYLARLFFKRMGENKVMEIRPSDGVAIALRAKIPIILNKRLLRGTLSPKDQDTLSDLVKAVKF